MSEHSIKLFVLVWMLGAGCTLLTYKLFIRSPTSSNERRGEENLSIPQPISAHVESNLNSYHMMPFNNPIPSDEVLHSMSHEDVQWLWHTYVMAPQVTCSAVVRMGGVMDETWEFCDDPRWAPPQHDRCLVYSYGINNLWVYDDAMAAYGCEVHAFDPSMKQKSHLRGVRVHFHDTGVANESRVVHNMGGTSGQNLKQDQTWQLYSMMDQRRMLDHLPSQRRLDVVKMDIDGPEVSVLTAALEDGALVDVRQLCFETHINVDVGVNPKQRGDPSHDQYVEFLRLFRRLYDEGFRIYHTNRNNNIFARFTSKVNPLKRHWTKCHEVHMININTINS